MTPLPHTISKGLATIVTRCLNKKCEQRPTISDIIMMDEFQEKSKLLKITLPAGLNKALLARRAEKSTSVVRQDLS